MQHATVADISQSLYLCVCLFEREREGERAKRRIEFNAKCGNFLNETNFCYCICSTRFHERVLSENRTRVEGREQERK